MPEGPEVKSIGEGLKCIVGFRISRVKVQSENENKFKLGDIEGEKILNVFTIGKKIFFQLKNGYIVTSLLMTGRWLFSPSLKKERGEEKGEPLLILVLKRRRGKKKEKEKKEKGEKIVLHYCDTRKFGDVFYINEEEFEELISSLGPDFLNDDITFKEFRDIIGNSKIQLFKLLIDQGKVSGIGNYLRCDILYHSRIDPFRKGSELNKEELKQLYESCKYIINKSYQSGGFSISNTKNNYILPNGKWGGYSPLIYKKEVDPDGNPVLKHKLKGSQTFYYVPFL